VSPADDDGKEREQEKILFLPCHILFIHREKEKDKITTFFALSYIYSEGERKG